MANMDAILLAIDDLKSEISSRMERMEGRMERMEGRMERMEGRMDRMEGRMDRMEIKLDSVALGLNCLEVKQQNSCLGRKDIICRIPLADGREMDVEYPANIATLLVAGNETTPGAEGGTTGWNAAKSREFLDAYNVPVDESVHNLASPTSKSRTLRLSVATTLGITRSQLNFAQMYI